MEALETKKSFEELSHDEYRKYARIFKALSDETRLKIMHYIIQEGRHCVMEIADALQISQTASSRNLKILREAGLLRDERINPCIFYEILPEHIELIDFITRKFEGEK